MGRLPSGVDGDDHAWGRQYHYGDWLALDNLSGKSDQLMGGTDESFIANVYYMGSAEILSKAATILGKVTDAKKYRSIANKLRRFIKNEYYSGSGHCCINTQTALLLTLKNQLSDDVEKTREALRKRFEINDDKLQTGFVGTPIMCGVLSRICY